MPTIQMNKTKRKIKIKRKEFGVRFRDMTDERVFVEYEKADKLEKKAKKADKIYYKARKKRLKFELDKRKVKHARR